MAEQLRALVVPEHGGPDVLRVENGPVPEPGPGQVLVRVAASGINFIDVYRREGRYPVQTPFVLGQECAGTVVACGPDVALVEPGQLVASAAADGSHATHTLIDAAQVVRVPDGVQPEVAAAAMLQGMTAHYLTRAAYRVASGNTVLVHAAAGGTGQLIVQLARAAGARVIATVGSPAKVEIARAAGADEVLRSDQVDDLAAAVRELEPEGVHVAYDGVGRATFEASLASLRRRGVLVLFGAASGPVPPFDLQRLNPAGSVYVTRPTLVDYIATRDELVLRAGEVLDSIADGSLRISIGGRYALDDAAQAYRDLESRSTTGKLLVIP